MVNYKKSESDKLVKIESNFYIVAAHFEDSSRLKKR